MSEESRRNLHLRQGEKGEVLFKYSIRIQGDALRIAHDINSPCLCDRRMRYPVKQVRPYPMLESRLTVDSTA